MISSTAPIPFPGIAPAESKATAPIEEPGAPIDIAKLNGGRQVEYINAALTQASRLLKAGDNRGGYDVVAKFAMTAHGDSRNIVLDIDMKAKKAGVASFAFRAMIDGDGVTRELPADPTAVEPKKKGRGRKKKDEAAEEPAPVTRGVSEGEFNGEAEQPAAAEA